MSKIFHIITIGCQMNISDSERFSAFMSSKGYRQSDAFRCATVVIINTCGVRQSAEDRVYGLVNRIRKLNPGAQIIITGCLSKRADVKRRLAGKADLFLPASEMTRLPELLAGREFMPRLSLDEVRSLKGEKYLAIMPQHESTYSAYVPIGNGCNNFCSYCVVPYARGREVYRPAKDVIREVRRLARQGYKEITLIAQNVNSYRDPKSTQEYDFSDLLSDALKVPGKFWLRFSSSHPKDMGEKLIAMLGKSEKICGHLHLAVQSGDDKILAAMNRKYTADHFLKLLEKVRRVRPEISITTDVIVGFPGESKAQFNNTLKLFRQARFDMAYIAQYSPRPGTVSAKMKDNVSREEKKRRDRELNAVLRKTALANNTAYLGAELEVLVDGVNKAGLAYGRSAGAKNVIIRDSKGKRAEKLIGDFHKVKIIAVQDFGLDGALIK